MESKLIIGADGFPRFPATTADLRWVDKAIDVNEILATTAVPFLSLVKANPKVARKILDVKIKNLEKTVKVV